MITATHVTLRLQQLDVVVFIGKEMLRMASNFLSSYIIEPEEIKGDEVCNGQKGTGRKMIGRERKGKGKGSDRKGQGSKRKRK